MARPDHNARHPVHVTTRVVADVSSLRHRDMYMQLREATIVTARREDFRIVHLSIQRNHIHLLVEADHKEALSRGMQGFSISAAKRINATITARTGIRRTGRVIDDRFHASGGCGSGRTTPPVARVGSSTIASTPVGQTNEHAARPRPRRPRPHRG